VTTTGRRPPLAAEETGQPIVVKANWRDNPWFPAVLEEERQLDLQLDPLGGGPKPDKLMRDALALELHQEVKLTTGEKIKKLRQVARTLVDNAIDGDTTAVRECFDRMDGKVTQSVDATQVRGGVTFTWKPPAKC
jgi:Family of unknown function (DUF5681)